LGGEVVPGRTKTKKSPGEKTSQRFQNFDKLNESKGPELPTDPKKTRISGIKLNITPWKEKGGGTNPSSRPREKKKIQGRSPETKKNAVS